MLKIKKEIDLDTLTKYGFNDYKYYYSKEIKYTVEEDTEVEIDIIIRRKDRQINLIHFISEDGIIEDFDIALVDGNIPPLDTIFDLIKDGLVEKV